MRIDPQQWDEWRSRLDRLELLKRQHPQLDWLWDVRIQVLRYFCSRYGRQLTEEQRRRTGMRLQREQLPSPSRSTIPIDQVATHPFAGGTAVGAGRSARCPLHGGVGYCGPTGYHAGHLIRPLQTVCILKPA